MTNGENVTGCLDLYSAAILDTKIVCRNFFCPTYLYGLGALMGQLCQDGVVA